MMSPVPAQEANAIRQVEGFHLAIPCAYGGPPPRGPAQWPRIQMLLVRVETADGMLGWGEAFGHNACAATKSALDTLVVPLCLGADAGDIEGIAARLRRALHLYGLDGPVGFALSGLDIALWDIRGKRAGQPLHRLLAPTSAATSVPAYASLLRYGDADLVAAAAADAVSRGHRAVKLHEATVEAVASAREAIGAEVPLTLDVNCRWSVEQAVGMARALRRYELAWLEEPCWPPDAANLARVGAAGVPIAAGENAGSLAELERIASIGKAAYIQPSAAKLGGISGLVAAQEIAKRHGVRIATHSAYFGPGLAATAHFCAAAGLTCEWYDCRLETDPWGFAPHGGSIPLPEAPGLGLDIDPALIARYLIS